MTPLRNADELLRAVAHLKRELRLLQPTIDRAQATRRALVPDFDRLVLEWARAEQSVAQRRREDRLYATLLDAGAPEQAREDAARAIVATYPTALSGGRRKYRARRADARQHRRHHRDWLHDLLTLGLRDTVKEGRHLQPQQIKLGASLPASSAVRVRYRTYKETRPIDLPPLDFREWLIRQAYRFVEKWLQADGIGLELSDERNDEALRQSARQAAPHAAQAGRGAVQATRWTAGLAHLTTREQQVAVLLAGGLNATQIGERLGITAGTVRALKRRIRARL